MYHLKKREQWKNNRKKNKFVDNCVTSKKLIFSRPPMEQQKLATFYKNHFYGLRIG